MAFDFSGLVGDKMGYTDGQASIPVTDLSSHVDGGQSAVSAHANTNSSDLETTVLYGGAAIVAAALGVLWFLGGIAFRGLPSL